MNSLQGFRALAGLAMTACSAGASADVALGANGLGQGLLFPYYTVEGGQATTIAVQNTTSSAKALKVRIIESYAGRDVLLFNVYLAPYATWSAAVIGESNGAGAALQFTPGTCTAPIPVRAEPLRNFAYTGSFEDEGNSDRTRTRQGQIEIIEMGTLDDSLVPIVSNPTADNCGILVGRWIDSGIWRQTGSANANLLAPSGGLRGDAIVINVAAGTAFGYQALGFTGLSTAPRHTQPGDSHPRLQDIPTAAGEDIDVTVIDSEGAAESLAYPADRGMDAISALLTYASVSSSYNVSPQLAARTDWIVSFPLRHAYIDDAPGGTLPSGTFPIAPFTSRICEEAILTRYDGSGRKLTTTESSPIDLCTQSQTLRFRHGSTDAPLVAGNDSLPVPADQSGTAVLDVSRVEGGPRRLRPDTNGRCVRGLPIWLLSATGYDNANAQPGRIATYPETRVGTGTRVIEDC